MRYPVYLAFAIVSFTACHNGTEPGGTGTATSGPQAPPESRLSANGTQKLMDVLHDYYALKDAFVASNPVDASLEAEKLMKTTEDFNIYLSNDSAASVLAGKDLDSIQDGARQISTIVSDIERMRVPFEKISDHVYAVLQKTGLKNARVYHAFCPMAFDDKGAYWLSAEAEIKNPYFGKKMLECGEVKDSIQ